jgi:hypothetical protein
VVPQLHCRRTVYLPTLDGRHRCQLKVGTGILIPNENQTWLHTITQPRMCCLFVCVESLDRASPWSIGLVRSVIVITIQDPTSSRLLPGSTYSCCIRNLNTSRYTSNSLVSRISSAFTTMFEEEFRTRFRPPLPLPSLSHTISVRSQDQALSTAQFRPDATTSTN